MKVSAAASGWAGWASGWALAHPEFWSSVNPITTRGQIVPSTLLLAHPNLKNQLHLCIRLEFANKINSSIFRPLCATVSESSQSLSWLRRFYSPDIILVLVSVYFHQLVGPVMGRFIFYVLTIFLFLFCFLTSLSYRVSP